MRELFKDKQPGDTLGAGHINKLNKIARIVANQNPGAFTYGTEYGHAGPTPYVQRVVIVTGVPESASSNSSSQSSGSTIDPDNGLVYKCKYRYYDPTVEDEEDRWKTDDDAGEFDLDAESVEIDLSKNDVLCAWWDPQRGAFIPLKSEGGGSLDRGSTTTSDCCGDCVKAGSIQDCAVVGEAANQYSFPTPNDLPTEHFGASIILTHYEDCI